MDLGEIAKAEDLIEEFESAGLGPVDPELLRFVIGARRSLTPPIGGAPIYAITAAIAEAYEDLLEEL